LDIVFTFFFIYFLRTKEEQKSHLQKKARTKGIFS
jgi:hypothetical protein